MIHVFSFVICNSYLRSCRSLIYLVLVTGTYFTGKVYCVIRYFVLSLESINVLTNNPGDATFQRRDCICLGPNLCQRRTLSYWLDSHRGREPKWPYEYKLSGPDKIRNINKKSSPSSGWNLKALALPRFDEYRTTKIQRNRNTFTGEELKDHINQSCKMDFKKR